MATTVISSDQARARWREVLDTAVAGSDVVVERYGKPAAAIIPYEDFLALAELLEELRDARDAQAALAEWQQDPSTGRAWEDVKAELNFQDS